MQYLHKCLLLIIFITLAWFTFLQFNDPDAVFWIIIYAVASLMPLLALLRRTFLPATLIASSLCLFELVLSSPGAYTYWMHRHDELLMQSMNPDKPYIEEAREFLGSLIALALIWISHYSGKYLKSR